MSGDIFLQMVALPVLLIVCAVLGKLFLHAAVWFYGSIILAGYLLGSIPVGYLVARAKGVDIRKQGSGNIGATNVFRTLGKGPGIFVFIFDALKGVFAVRLAIAFLARHPVVWQEQVVHQGDAILHTMHFLQPAMAGIIGGVAAIIGHNFPVWLKFKGGKGVATSLGVVIALTPLAAAVAFGVWAVVFFASRYVSLASIIAAIAVPATVALTEHGGDRTALLAFTSLAALLIVLRHRKNIERLYNGTENRFGKPKPSKP
jgi:acyl phosphate:glycerol-3-phosphate acyltransferase